MDFTLHTGPRAEVPEFTISCRTYGGPATTVVWAVDGTIITDDNETSQVILDTSQISVYDNRLREKGRNAREYSCAVSNSISFPDDNVFTPLIGRIIFLYLLSLICSCRRAHQTEDCHLWLQHYTCECGSVLGVTKRRCQWLYDLLPD